MHRILKGAEGRWRRAMSNAVVIPQIDWTMIMPITIVSLTGIFALLMETIWPKRASAGQWLVSLVGLGAAGISLALQWYADEDSTLGGLLIRDRFGIVVQLLILAAAFMTILF